MEKKTKKVSNKVTKKKVNQKNKKKKGFTLVELLAVIVVLAIIMIIAIPSVLKSMNNAKKGAFKIECQKVLNTAQSTFESDKMLNEDNLTKIKHYSFDEMANVLVKTKYDIRFLSTNGGEYLGRTNEIDDIENFYQNSVNDAYCYTIDDLGINASNKYFGYVLIFVNDNDQNLYFLYLTDSGFSSPGLTYKELDKYISNKKNSQIKTKCPENIYDNSDDFTIPDYFIRMYNNNKRR